MLLHFTRYTTKYIPGAQLPGFSLMCFEAHVPLEVPLHRGRVATAVPRARERSLTRVRPHVHPEVLGSRGRVVTACPRAGKRSLTHVRPHVPLEAAGLRGRVVTAGPRACKLSSEANSSSNSSSSSRSAMDAMAALRLLLSARAAGGGCRPSGQTQSSCAQVQTRGRGSPLSAARMAPRYVPDGIGPGDGRSKWCIPGALLHEPAGRILTGAKSYTKNSCRF
jgi:hypothetical protein